MEVFLIFVLQFQFQIEDETAYGHHWVFLMITWTSISMMKMKKPFQNHKTSKGPVWAICLVEEDQRKVNPPKKVVKEVA